MPSENEDPRRPRWWTYVGALVLVAFLFSFTGSLLVSAGFLVLFAVFIGWQLWQSGRRQPAPAHYCRSCGETLDRNARQCRKCGSASWSVR